MCWLSRNGCDPRAREEYLEGYGRVGRGCRPAARKSPRGKREITYMHILQRRENLAARSCSYWLGARCAPWVRDAGRKTQAIPPHSSAWRKAVRWCGGTFVKQQLETHNRTGKGEQSAAKGICQYIQSKDKTEPRLYPNRLSEAVLDGPAATREQT